MLQRPSPHFAFISAPLALPRSSPQPTKHSPIHHGRPPLHITSRRPRTRPNLPCMCNPNPAPKPATNPLQSLLNSRSLLGQPLTPELLAVLCVYFVQGALSISRLAISFFLKDELQLPPSAAASIAAIAALPWVAKPLYGFLSDTVPILGSRRRAYLALSGILGASSWLYLATSATTSRTALIATAAASAAVAISDVVADAIVVERARKSPPSAAAELQTLCWGSSAVGGLIAAALSGGLTAALGPRRVFGLTAVLPAATAMLALLVTETKAPAVRPEKLARAARERATTLWNALTARNVLLPVAFVFVWQAAPNPDSALFYFQTTELHFGAPFLGVVRFVSSAAALGGLFCYQRFWRTLPVKTLMMYAALASVPLSLTQVVLVTRLNVAFGVSDQLFALTDSAVLTALGQVAFMPTLVLAARLCPPGIEGTLFAALMSVYNASGVVSNQLGAVLTHALGVTETDFTNLWLLVTICSLSNLLALPLLDFLDEAPEPVDSEALPAAGNGVAEQDPADRNGALDDRVVANSVSDAVQDAVSTSDRNSIEKG